MGGVEQATNGFDTDARDLLMPLNIQINDMGHIVHVGPTMKKICGDQEIIGRRFLEVFEVKRPSHVSTFSDLRDLSKGKIRLQFRNGLKYVMKGLFVHLKAEKCLLLNVSLGVSVVDAVARFNLSTGDFAHSDPTVDMLYLIEAKTVALDESKRLNSRLQGAKNIAEEQAFTDTLTGLKNRRASDNMLEKLEKSKASFGLMHLDLDYFKQVNDTLGHAAGDFVLQNVARALKSATRNDDLVARIGGDEFVLIFRDCVDTEVLDQIATRIIELLEKPVVFEGQICRISASIGTTLSSFYENATADAMMHDADQALYASKDKGRARHTFFEPQMVDLDRREPRPDTHTESQ